MNTEPYLISPSRIVRRSKEFKPQEQTQVMPGDWDTWNHTFEGSVIFYSSFKQLFESSMVISNWQKTAYYKYILKNMKDNPRWGCDTVEKIDARCKKLEEIFIDIRDNGWKDDNPIDRVGINLDRNGGILFNNGRHRLTFAKILGIKEIPVNINVQHTEWKIFKDSFIFPYYKSRGRIYAPIINHPDLEHLKSVHGHDRWDIIKKAIIDIGEPDFGKSKAVLDIGAHWGYFSHQFALKGYQVSAVENDLKHFIVLDKLSKLYPSVTCHNCSVFNMPTEDHHYGIVLALNIFHHFLKTKEFHDKLISLLRNLNFSVMFFQPHHSTEGQMNGAYYNPAYSEFVEFILKHTGKENFDQLGFSESDKRPMYVIY